MFNLFSSLSKQCFLNQNAFQLTSGFFGSRTLFNAAFGRNCNETLLRLQSGTTVAVRTAKEGETYRPNLYKRQKSHGLQKRKSTTNGKITLIRRMIKGVSRRKLTV